METRPGEPAVRAPGDGYLAPMYSGKRIPDAEQWMRAQGRITVLKDDRDRGA